MEQYEIGEMVTNISIELDYIKRLAAKHEHNDTATQAIYDALTTMYQILDTTILKVEKANAA